MTESDSRLVEHFLHFIECQCCTRRKTKKKSLNGFKYEGNNIIEESLSNEKVFYAAYVMHDGDFSELMMDLIY